MIIIHSHHHQSVLLHTSLSFNYCSSCICVHNFPALLTSLTTSPPCPWSFQQPFIQHTIYFVLSTELSTCNSCPTFLAEVPLPDVPNFLVLHFIPSYLFLIYGTWLAEYGSHLNVHSEPHWEPGISFVVGKSCA
jgi:hypothetical protein